MTTTKTAKRPARTEVPDTSRPRRPRGPHDDEDQDVSTAHEEHEAFGLIDDAMEALFHATRDENSDPNDVAVDAVLIVGVQRVDGDGDGARVEHVEVFPRPGAQPAPTRALISEAGKLLDQATARTATPATTAATTDPGGWTPHPHHKAPPMA